MKKNMSIHFGQELAHVSPPLRIELSSPLKVTPQPYRFVTDRLAVPRQSMKTIMKNHDSYLADMGTGTAHGGGFPQRGLATQRRPGVEGRNVPGDARPPGTSGQAVAGARVLQQRRLLHRLLHIAVFPRVLSPRRLRAPQRRSLCPVPPGPEHHLPAAIHGITDFLS